jgi:hypothetical protein
VIVIGGVEHLTKSEVEAIVKARVRRLQSEALALVARTAHAEAVAASVPAALARAETAEARLMHLRAAVRCGVTDLDVVATIEHAWSGLVTPPPFDAWIAQVLADPSRAPDFVRPFSSG